jgi:hypothetical protein
MHAPTPPQAPVPPDPIRGRLRHTAGSRTRIALDRPLPDRTGLTRWAEALATLTGVRAIDIRVTTGSLVLHHEGRFEPVARAAAEAGLLVLHPAEATPSLDPMRETALRLGRMDARVARLTHGRIDLWGLGYTALVMAGLVQLARGRVAGPAVTLFGQAATLVLARSLREPVPGRDGPRTD